MVKDKKNTVFTKEFVAFKASLDEDFFPIFFRNSQRLWPISERETHAVTQVTQGRFRFTEMTFKMSSKSSKHSNAENKVYKQVI